MLLPVRVSDVPDPPTEIALVDVHAAPVVASGSTQGSHASCGIRGPVVDRFATVTAGPWHAFGSGVAGASEAHDQQLQVNGQEASFGISLPVTTAQCFQNSGKASQWSL